MSTDLEWALEVLDKLRGHYIALVKSNSLEPGVCWLLKPITTLINKHPAMIHVCDVVGMGPEETVEFWEPFGRNYAEKIQQHFGDTAVVRKYSKAWTVIFKTPGMDASLETPAGSCLATQDMASKFTIRLPKRPSNIPASVVNPFAYTLSSPRRSPPRAACHRTNGPVFQAFLLQDPHPKNTNLLLKFY
jgi:hypothetical protein